MYSGLKLLLLPRMNLLWAEQDLFLKSLRFYATTSYFCVTHLRCIISLQQVIKNICTLKPLRSSSNLLILAFWQTLKLFQCWVRLPSLHRKLSKEQFWFSLLSDNWKGYHELSRCLTRIFPGEDDDQMSHRVPPPSTYERSSTTRDRAWGWGREMFPRLPEARRCTGWDVQSSGCLARGPGWLGSSAGDSGLALRSRESVSQERRVCAGEAPRGEGCCSSSGHFVLLNVSQQFCINKGVNSAWNMAKASGLSFHWYKLNWIKY